VIFSDALGDSSKELRREARSQTGAFSGPFGVLGAPRRVLGTDGFPLVFRMRVTSRASKFSYQLESLILAQNERWRQA
jgi:hypothetical protein